MAKGIQFNRLVLRNFLSFGQNPTTIDLRGKRITVVLGLNHDTGGDESRNGVGKAQPLHSKILTPYGWTTMGDLKVGSPVLTPTGATTLVTGVFPQGDQQTYKITFVDGRTVECDQNHLWKVWGRHTGEWSYRVLSTLEMIDHLEKKNSPGNRLFVPLFMGQRELPDQYVPIHPYVIGALIGDGNLTSGVRFTSADQHIVDRISDLLPPDHTIHPSTGKMAYYVTDNLRGGTNRMRSALSLLGLWGSRSWDKHIPEVYKNLSYRQTVDLLQGLLDTDGTVDGHGSITYTTVSQQLALDIQYLVQSVGGIATITWSDNKYTVLPDGTRKPGRRAYRVGIRHPDRLTLFSLPRKKDRISTPYQYQDTLRLRIESIERHTIQPTQCISVLDEDHLYVTDGFVVTHNTAIIDSISYALFGTTIRGISNQKLVNSRMRKGQGMMVILELDTTEGSYRIERGEAPSKLRLLRKELDDPADFLTRDGTKFVYDITRSKAETTTQIEGLLGFDIKLFEFLIANSSESIPFMKLPEDKKREIAERLMGLNRLTERAEELKEERKDQKRNLVAAESSLEATQQANRRVETQINDLVNKERMWESQRTQKMTDLRDKIDRMGAIDVGEQIEILKMIDELTAENNRVIAARNEANLLLRSAQRDLADIQSNIDRSTRERDELVKKKAKLDASECPTCAQHWVADAQVLVKCQHDIETLETVLTEAQPKVAPAEAAIAEIKTTLADIAIEVQVIEETAGELGDFPLAFDSIQEASAVEAQIAGFVRELTEAEKAENPHTDTITQLRNQAMVSIDDSEIRDLRSLITHYNYLIDLLQSKDSFLRKAVIDRWLPRLNGRIAHYLDILELPYVVRVENDLNMSILDFGQEFDWGNLSKGQRQRVTIALNLAFQDLFEATNQPLSLLMVDELIDSGICNRGASQAVHALRETCANKDKRVFLITHRADIADQVEDVMVVEMKNKISRIAETELEPVMEEDPGEIDV